MARGADWNVRGCASRTEDERGPDTEARGGGRENGDRGSVRKGDGESRAREKGRGQKPEWGGERGTNGGHRGMGMGVV